MVISAAAFSLARVPALAAASLSALTLAILMGGGIAAWKAAGLPVFSLGSQR